VAAEPGGQQIRRCRRHRWFCNRYRSVRETEEEVIHGSDRFRSHTVQELQRRKILKRFTAILLATGLLTVALAVPAAAAPKNKGTTFIDPSPITVSVLRSVSKPVLDGLTLLFTETASQAILGDGSIAGLERPAVDEHCMIRDG